MNLRTTLLAPLLLVVSCGAFAAPQPPKQAQATALTTPVNLVADGSFELQTGSGIGPYWQGSAVIETGPVAARGTKSARIQADSGWNPLQQWIAVKPFAHYVASVAVQSSDNMNDAYYSVRGNSNFQILNQVSFGAVASSAYKTIRFEFDTGNDTSALLYVGMWASSPATWLRVDDVILSEAPSDVTNGRLETSSAGWQITGSGAIESSPHTGAGALVLRGTSGWTSANQWISVTKNTRYRAGAWVKTSATRIDGYFSIRGNASQSSSDVIHQVHFGAIANDYQWLTFDFDTGPNTSVLLYAGFWGPGAPTFVALDDVSVTKIVLLQGNYGYLTEYHCMSEREARDRIDTMVAKFHITDVQFYDWFANYETPTAGDSWTDPWFHARPICRQTIAWYIDELHKTGARAWAYVQSVAAENENLANPTAGVFKVIDANGNWFHMGTHPTYFANAAWADHQVATWAPDIAALGFDGIHWDTLGHIAGDYNAEAFGIRAFLRQAALQLAKHRLMQTMNFLDLNFWDESLLDSIGFPYAEVWSGSSKQALYAAMGSAPMELRGGVMAFYPSVDESGDRGQSVPYQHAAMLSRWTEAPPHHLRYLVVGDGTRRLDNEYFPIGVPLTPPEIDTLSR